jgi:hypothetical protein
MFNHAIAIKHHGCWLQDPVMLFSWPCRYHHRMFFAELGAVFDRIAAGSF